MYTLDKLKNMSILLGNDTVDGELATYFINNLNNLSTMTLQKCINETGISKASIHRFYSKAGFINFKNFINVLNEESKEFYSNGLENYINKIVEFTNNYDFSLIDKSGLFNKLKKADKIIIYANLRDVYNFGSTISKLRSMNKKVISLNKWNIESNYEVIKDLKEDDVFIIINTSMNIQNYHENSINNLYLLSFEKINEYKLNKFYIGQANKNDYLGFNLIKLPDYGEEISIVIISILDKYICEKISEGVIK